MRSAMVMLALCLAGCAGAPPGGIADPYEPMNRRVHAFNKALDANVLRPVAGAMPRDAAPLPESGNRPPGPIEMVGNFGANLSLPGKVVNSLLQGRPGPAIHNGFRFAVNSTVGVGGILDPAGGGFGLPEIDTDFGETLHVWGVPAGAYLELPLLGPSNQRDLAGKIVDFVLIDPLDSVLTDEQKLAGTAARVVSKAGERGRFGSTVDSVLHESADSYAQTRLLYTQHRRYELKQEEDAIDPYAE
ncbi:VacJ family lipoprotein [Paracoccus sp. (in: a-proteobacteria)]|uniref:MlaA family lipoprotein n=1 Tax=Paracoccus sp. TaxID=267 RepID=UPI0026DFFA60|nr:VacJ family lipoprotein [Paracoccus sp. (in: a-proteobacteria)]MDO5369443.1 VacJ family lipoprotein [Paracoccus sp. (in: a-proteobacteria)]